MKFHWLLPSTFLSLVLLSSPAFAGRLQSWRFDADRNRLVFTTDSSVQPKAQLLFNPTRLVIDLPGTAFLRPTVNQQLRGAMRQMRVGQLDPQTTRLVIELSPGYTLDPQQVKFQGISPRQWLVQLPTPIRSDEQTSSASVSLGSPEATASVTSDSVAQIQDVQVTPDGFFIRTSGPNPEVKVRRSGDRDTIDIYLEGAALSSELTLKDLSVNRNGVSRIQLSQVQNTPPIARLTLQVDKESPDWQARISNLGGIVVLPTLGQESSSERRSDDRLATVQSVEVSGNQLLVRANQPFTYTSGWDQSSGAYRITIPAAKLAERVREPESNANSPVLRVRLRQQDPSTVVVLVLPASGVQIGEINQPSPQLLALPLRGSRREIVVPPPNRTTVSVPDSVPDYPRNERPRPRDGRILVMIDPGHGGKDVGAIGIGGLQEKDVILPISQEVARLLQRQGIQVVMTRNDDYFVDLAPRVQMARRENADLFVSIHANAIDMTRPDISGLETYYYSSSEGERLARTIHNSILQSIDIPDRRVRQARFYVLRHNPMPAVLVEVGFVTGAQDAPRLASPAYQRRMAEAIARGILQYLQQSY
ncbi:MULTISPECIES: N-acetylmuramoyl-L-alanine amidase [Aerosakkonema]|uniref:N-acetylmuramoyl-L-alanine amidase n=1 Tax=Aerosakkonema TaxID=1246629 RepID=UPI0035BB0B31